MNQFLNERPAMAATHKHKLFCNVRRPFQWKTVTNLYYAAKPQDDEHLAAASNQDNYIQYCCYSNRTKIAVPGSISTVVTTATVQTERGQGEEIWDPPLILPWIVSIRPHSMNQRLSCVLMLASMIIVSASIILWPGHVAACLVTQSSD